MSIGVIEGANEAEVQERLLAGGFLLELKTIKSKHHFSLNRTELLELTYQLYQLLAAGLPIYESLLSLQEKKVRYSPLISAMSQGIGEGKTLTDILAVHGATFNPLYCAVIGASEASGELKEGFFALKRLLEKQQKLIKILKNALIYPCILLVFAFGIVNALLFIIIPSLKELFDGREVGGLTRGVLASSQFAIDHQGLFLCLGIGLMGSMVVLGKLGFLKRAVLYLCRFIPFCHRLVMDLKFENFFACLSLLLSRGINLKMALELSKNVLSHPSLEQVVDQVVEGILQGKRFSETLGSPFPLVVKRLIGLSEVTGQMNLACENLSTLFHEEVEKKLAALTTFLQPLLLAFIGLIVGLVVLSILVPLTDVGSFI